MTTSSHLDLTFANLTAESPIDALCSAAYQAARRSAQSDVRQPSVVPTLASDEATAAYLHDPTTRECLEAWLVSYDYDERLLSSVSDDARAEVLASAWRGYEATVMQARDAARAT